MNKIGFNLPLSIQAFNDAVKNIAKSIQKTTALFTDDAIKIILIYYPTLDNFCDKHNLVRLNTWTSGMTDTMYVIAEVDFVLRNWGTFTVPVWVVSEEIKFIGGTDLVKEDISANDVVISEQRSLKIEVL